MQRVQSNISGCIDRFDHNQRLKHYFLRFLVMESAIWISKIINWNAEKRQRLIDE